ncbi:MAG: bifunctional histidinol-phosphatase/imidazoleglycerol-phosphate dehydratase HisB [Proteobacteria bacterium]|nr:bifunctional histidinol-phosphatase/imidazoleglycerol-phosphate dehydratase HisB [Pseudomonadota bacterium]
MKKILFVDRDGTLIQEPKDYQVDSIHKLKLMDHVIVALTELAKHDYRFVMITNQDGLGTSSFLQKDFDGPQKMLLDILASQGIDFDDVLICPHLPTDHCSCRKPQLGLLTSYLQRQDIHWPSCYVIGDRESDMELARAMKLKSFMIKGPLNTNNTKHTESYDWLEVVSHILSQPRRASLRRTTKETDIIITTDLDSPTKAPKIHTGLPFFDHMLEQIGYHGSISLDITAKGDLEVDHHHTIEDTAISLGECLRQALGDRKRIHRYGFTLPMDDSRCEVLLDLAQRPYFLFEGSFPETTISGIHTQMFKHFFRSLCFSLLCNLHIRISGENSHHMIEAMFKCFARAFNKAICRQHSHHLPSSSKGVT